MAHTNEVGAVPVLTVNGRRFARTTKHFEASLSDPTRRCIGLFRPRPSGVLLMDPQKSPVAFIVNNRHRERFIVTASRQADGRTWYMYSTTRVTELFLGLTDMTYSQKLGVAEAAIAELTAAVAVSVPVPEANGSVLSPAVQSPATEDCQQVCEPQRGLG